MASESKGRRNANHAPRSTAPRRRTRRGIADLFALDSESSARLLLFGAVAVILAIAAAFIGFGYWYAEIRPEGRTVLKADGIEVSFASMKRRMEYELFVFPQYVQVPEALPEVAYANLVRELTLISRADDEFGITVTEEDIDAEIRNSIGVAQDADQRVFADRFREELSKSNLTESEYRRVVHAALLEERIVEKFTTEAPAAVEQVRVEMISTSDLEAAEAARGRVAAGEDWGTVARELSTLPDASTNGGLQDYEPVGALNEAVDAWAFDAEVGAISEPLSSISGQGPYYIVRLVDRSEQPLREGQKPDYAQRQLEDWLEATQANMAIERSWDTDDQREALSEIDLTPAQPAPPVLVPTFTLDTPAPGVTAPVQIPTVAPGGENDTNPDPSGAPQPDDGQ